MTATTKTSVTNTHSTNKAAGSKKPRSDEPILELDFQTKMTKDGIFQVTSDGLRPLANFRAKITEEILVYEGDAMAERRYGMLAKVSGRAVSFSVAQPEFESLRWVPKHLGAEAMIQPGHRNRDLIRLTIQMESHNRKIIHVYDQMGFRHIGDELSYLHPGGVLVAKGRDQPEDVRVELHPTFDNFGFPTAGESELSIKACLHETLSVRNIAPRNRAIGSMILASAFRSVLTFFHDSTVAPFYVGPTGTYKSSVAAIAQSFFGPAFTVESLPVNLTSTAKGIDRRIRESKHTLFTVDEYTPSRANLDVFEEFSERVIFNNSTSTGRVTAQSTKDSDGSLPIQTVVTVTGEVALVAESYSRHARVFYCPIAEGEVATDRLSAMQELAQQGCFARVMRAFIERCLGTEEELEASVPATFRRYREEAMKKLPSSLHPRVAPNAADLMVGLHFFLRFCLKKKVISSAKYRKLRARCWRDILQLAEQQADIPRWYSQRRMVTDAIMDLLQNGDLHLVEFGSGKEPNLDDSSVVGWQDGEPMGPCLGYVDSERQEVFVPSDNTFRVLLEQLPTNVSYMFSDSPSLFWKEMVNYGMLTQTGAGKNVSRRRKGIHKGTVYSVYLPDVFE